MLRRGEERAPSRGEVGGSENQAYCLPAVIARKRGGRTTRPEPNTATESGLPKLQSVNYINVKWRVKDSRN